jgi:hypothetical protein
MDFFTDLKVECRAGYKADETPVRFTVNERRFEVVEILDRWYDPSADYFKVRADDGCFYLLKRDRTSDEWSLRYVRTAEPATPVISPPPGAGREPH